MPGTLSPRGRAQLARDLEVDSVHPETIGDLHRAEERRDTGVAIERVVRGEVDRLEDQPLHRREAPAAEPAPTATNRPAPRAPRAAPAPRRPRAPHPPPPRKGRVIP